MDITTTSVTGVLVTGKTTERYPLARISVDGWLKQDYPGPRKLLIINDHPTDALYPEGAPEGTIELRPQGDFRLGDLRNIGIEQADTDYIVQWDDDDRSRYDRLSWQVDSTDQGKMSIFRWEIHYNLTNGKAFANCGDEIRCKGFPGTMLWPRNCKTRFPSKGKAEDTIFALDAKKEVGLQVLQNNPCLYLRCFHGNNTWSEKHVMKRKRGSRDLTLAEHVYVDRLRDTVYKDYLENQ